MKITDEQYEKIRKLMPTQHGNVKIDNRTVINALLYICENGCKWRRLPSEFGNWHVIYKRYERLVKNGIISNLFKELAQQGILEITGEEVLCLDSTTIKVHPNAHGALKKMVNNPSENQ